MTSFASTFAGNPSASSSEFQYYADGKVAFADNLASDTLDRSYTYDQVGRLTQALTGSEARGGTTKDGPYRRSFSYNVWDNMSSRSNRFWSAAEEVYSATYANDRNGAWTYNAAGEVTDDTMHHVYNTAGFHVTATANAFADIQQTYNGDGLPVRREENRPLFSDVMYYLRSSVLGGRVVAELTAQGTRKRSYAYANGEEIARFDGDTQNLLFTMRNPVTGCSAFQQLDPTGAYVGSDDPYLKHQNVDYGTLKGADGFAPDFFVGDGNPFDQGAGCTWNQMPVSCGYIAHLLGASVSAPQDQVISVRNGGEWVLARFQAFADGYQGYVAVTENYVGEGVLRPKSINPRTKGKPRLGGYDGPSNKGNWGGADGATDGDPEVLLARSTNFKEGPLWNNAKREVRERLAYIIGQVLASGDCVYWFEGETHRVGHPAKLQELFKTTGLNFYLSGDPVSLGSLPSKPTPLNTSAFGSRGDAIAQTLGRGTSSVQIVFNRSVFDNFNNPRLAEEVIHEMFHAAGLRGSAPTGTGFFGWNRANDLNPEVLWDDIRKHCGQYVK